MTPLSTYACQLLGHIPLFLLGLRRWLHYELVMLFIKELVPED
jgi:hypothetical protein